MSEAWVDIDCLNPDGCNLTWADEWSTFVVPGGWGDGVDAERPEVVQAYVQEHGCPDCGGPAELMGWSLHRGDDVVGSWSAE